jgi:hypothetical protein
MAMLLVEHSRSTSLPLILVYPHQYQRWDFSFEGEPFFLVTSLVLLIKIQGDFTR